ncbi:DUF4817 domain-containing protein [Trichonephila clavipes]|nr:DUF4817 domain-containing protein [Trichonephila clavipes]
MIKPFPKKIIWCYGVYQALYEEMLNISFHEGIPSNLHQYSDALIVIDDLMGKEIREISLNAHYLVLFKNRRDQSQITHLGRQLYPRKVKFFQECYADATSKQYGYLLIDLKPETDESLRVHTDSDLFHSCQVIYSQFGLAIHQNDHQARRRFVEWAQNEIAVVPDFHKRILFSDEAHFWLNGYVNKQNCRIWSEANPQVYVETPLHPEKLTELWFQQDGTTCHTARATIDLLKGTFGDRLISRFGPVNWPPRSCDLTPLDYFLWGYVKSLVYADKTQTLDHLEDNIRRVIADIRPQMLEKVIENWTSRLDYIRDSRGSPMPEIIFKM